MTPEAIPARLRAEMLARVHGAAPGGDAAGGAEMRVLPHDVFHFPGALRLDEQYVFLRECDRLSRAPWNAALSRDEERISEARRARSPHVCLYHNWSSHPDSLGRQHASADWLEGTASRLCAPAPVLFAPNAMYSIVYPPAGRFGLHVDGANGWVLAVSIGSACTFKYGPTPDELTHVRVASGDALLFKGGELFHGVDAMVAGTAPDFYDAFGITKGTARLNVQFRDAGADLMAGRYTPEFVHYNQAQWGGKPCAGCSGCVRCFPRRKEGAG